MSKDLIAERLKLVLDSLIAIQTYLQRIKGYEDFYIKEGALIHDAVLMRLQVVGENIKKIDKKAPALIDINKEEISSIVRFRNLISHHYEKLDTELVFEICTQYLPRLKQQIEELLNSHK